MNSGSESAGGLDYRALVYSFDEGFCVIDLLFDASGRAHDFRFVDVNPQFEQQTGFSAPVGKTICELDPGHKDEPIEVYARVAVTGKPLRRELEGRRAGHWYEIYAFPIGTPEQRRVGILFKDVTQRRLAEEAGRVSEQRLRLSLIASGMGTFIWHVAEDRTDPDPKMLALFGLKESADLNLAEALGKLIHEEDRAHYVQAVQRALDPSGDGMLRDHIRVRRADDGAERWISIIGQAFFEGSPRRGVRIAGMAADITEQKRTETVLRHSEERQAFLLKLSDVLRPLTDPLEVQATATRVLGEYLGATRAFYSEVENDEDSEYFVVNRSYHLPDAPSLVGRYRGNHFGAAVFERMRAGQTLVVADVASEPMLKAKERAAYPATGIVAYVLVPLVKEGRLVAFFAVHQAVARAWLQREVDLVEETAERTWAAVERARAEHALKEANVRKDEFLAVLAHELRNPLAPVRTGLELLRLSADNPAAIERVRTMMERQVGHMTRLIDDLLDVSRITSGKIRLQKEHALLMALVNDAIEANQAALDAGGLKLSVDLPKEPVTLQVDPVRFVQVASNLLHNAIKFTARDGEICIAARVAAPGGTAGGAETLTLTVSDSGAGIPRELLPRVFDLFIQGDSAIHGARAGLGIGLALAQRLVELHGGLIEAFSEGNGKGSLFTVRLPVVTSAAPAVRTPLVASSGHRSRVVVIDDNQDSANSMAMLVSVLGGEARVAYDGENGLNEVLAYRPDVVLLDIGMPGINGYETCRRIRKALGLDVLVVALTGWGQEHDKANARAAGFDAHLTKPAEPATLERFLSDPRAARSGPNSAPG